MLLSKTTYMRASHMNFSTSPISNVNGGSRSIDELAREKSAQNIDKSMKDKFMEETVNENDEKRFIEKVKEAEDDWRVLDAKVDDFCTEVQEEEELIDTEEDESRLSQYITKRRDKNDQIIGVYDKAMDEALLDHNKERFEKSLSLNRMIKSTENNLKTLEAVSRELEASGDDMSEVGAAESDFLRDRLQEQRDKLLALQKESHSSDLPLINPNSANPPSPSSSENFSDTNNVPGQSSAASAEKEGSLLDEFADPSTEPADYMGGDD